MNGWNAESDAAALLSNLGISEDMHYTLMSEMMVSSKYVYFSHKPSSAIPMY